MCLLRSTRTSGVWVSEGQEVPSWAGWYFLELLNKLHPRYQIHIDVHAHIIVQRIVIYPLRVLQLHVLSLALISFLLFFYGKTEKKHPIRRRPDQVLYIEMEYDHYMINELRYLPKETL